MSAALARLSESSQPDASVAVSRMTSTPSSTKSANASSCDCWSLGLAAGAYSSSKPAPVNISLIACSFALRQPPSGPTATKPTVAGSVLGRLAAEVDIAATGATSQAEGQRPRGEDTDRSRDSLPDGHVSSWDARRSSVVRGDPCGHSDVSVNLPCRQGDCALFPHVWVNSHPAPVNSWLTIAVASTYG